jgi:hypothetical protein
LARSLAGRWQDRLPPPKRRGGRGRQQVDQGRQHERLGVPERVPVIARTGQAFGGNGAVFAARPGLQDLEHAKPDGLLQLGVAVQLGVRTLPEVVQRLPLLGQQTVPPGVAGCAECRRHLCPRRRR